MLNKTLITTLLLLSALFMLAAGEAPIQNGAERLGEELTAMGAIQGANKDGSIPAWTGGLTQPVAGWKSGDHYADPFPGDKVLYTVTAENADKYKDILSPGQLAMLQRYPDTWKLNVYQTRRTAAYPEDIYAAAKENATTASLTDEGNGVKDCRRTSPFPVPTEGLHGIWNHLLRYRGKSTRRTVGQVAPIADGRHTMVTIEEEVLYRYNAEGMTSESAKNILAKFYQGVTGPPRLAGTKLHVHETLDQTSDPRKAWVYDKGLRRVRRAPQVSFDNPGTASDGQRTNDQFDMFNGSPERYDWKLVGRRELLVPYNCYKAHNAEVDPKNLIEAGHLNPDMLRYEKHRVWEVDAVVKDGTSHLYKRRTFFFDEDSWQALVIDQYDNSDNIWRVSEAYPIIYYDLPALYDTLLSHYDLDNGRYLTIGFNAKGNVEKWVSDLKDSDFSAASLSRRGKR